MEEISQFIKQCQLIAVYFSIHPLHIDHIFNILVGDVECTSMLQGIVYYGDSHFTAPVATTTGMVWFHDGTAMGHSLLYEGMFRNMSMPTNVKMTLWLSMLKCKEHPSSSMFYTPA
jgi:hypothetical protein